MMSAASTSYCAARVSSVSVAATVTTTPLTGGIVEALADVEVVLELEVVGPPDGHHRDVEVAGDAGQRVAGPDP